METSVLKSNQQINPQHYIISGVKFFKGTLDKLRLDAQRTDDPLTCSQISLLMILHTYADEAGQIHSLTTDTTISDNRLLCISNIAKDHELVYETTKKAMDKLIDRNYVKESYAPNGMYYTLVDYAELNNADNLNYFRIPQQLFDEKIFGQLIKHRYHKAPLLLLDLSQYFTRQIGTTKRYADLDSLKGIRTMSYLKESLQTTAERVRNFLTVIKNIFMFKPIDQVIKKPSEDRFNRIRKFTQICINKFEFALNPSCFIQNDKHKEKSTIALAKREVANKFKNANIGMRWRDMLDVNKSVSRISRLSLHLDSINKGSDMLRYTIIQACDVVENLHNSGELKDIRSIGAFFNKLISNAWADYRKTKLTVGDELEIMHAYHKKYGENPDFLL